jgi:hypothetical protein
MYLFKTSGSTLPGVVAHQKHAYRNKPAGWSVGELVLVSKNRADCSSGEKQIQYVMRLRNIRPLAPGEAERLWPGNEGRWRYLVECSDTHSIRSSARCRSSRSTNASDHPTRSAAARRSMMSTEPIDIGS